MHTGTELGPTQLQLVCPKDNGKSTINKTPICHKINAKPYKYRTRSAVMVFGFDKVTGLINGV